MKAWTDLHLIAEPPAVAALDKDARGYPIPEFATLYTDGSSDFKLIDNDKWFRCIQRKRCAICGGKIGGLFAFVGGPLSTKNRTYTDAPMHKDCAEYALRACPFLAAPKFGYDKKLQGYSELDPTRPDRYGLGITSGYEVIRLGNSGVALKAAPFVSLTWWERGQPLDKETS